MIVAHAGSECPVNDTGHVFEDRVVESTPPTVEQMEAADVSGFEDSDAVEQVIKALSARKMVVACRDCGLVIAAPDGIAQPDSKAP